MNSVSAQTAKRWPMLVGLVIGALACGVILGARDYVANCVIGTPAQDAANVASHVPSMLSALARVREERALPADAMDPIAANVLYAWSHLRHCAGQRGLNHCQAIGTQPDIDIRTPDKGGPQAKDADLYRYPISPDLPGPRFGMTFWPKGFSEWTEIRMEFPDEPGVEVLVNLDWQPCSQALSKYTVRLAAVNELKR